MESPVMLRRYGSPTMIIGRWRMLARTKTWNCSRKSYGSWSVPVGDRRFKSAELTSSCHSRSHSCTSHHHNLHYIIINCITSEQTMNHSVSQWLYADFGCKFVTTYCKTFRCEAFCNSEWQWSSKFTQEWKTEKDIPGPVSGLDITENVWHTLNWSYRVRLMQLKMCATKVDQCPLHDIGYIQNLYASIPHLLIW